MLALGGMATMSGCASSPEPSAEASPTPTRAEAIAQIDSSLEAMVSNGFAGTVLVKVGGATLLDKGHGLADPAAHRPMTRDTGFDMGSLVKPITASAILKLESAGALQTTDPANRFLPQLTGDKAAITIDQLLRHTAGLPDFVAAGGQVAGDYRTADPDYELVTKEELLTRVHLCALQHAPGSTESYSNTGYSLLAAIIEAAAAQPYEQFVQENIFAPAGMTRTGYVLPHWSKQELAVGISEGQPWGTPLDHPWLPDGPSWNLRGNGGMLTTSGELAKWIDAIPRGAMLSDAARDKFFDLYVRRNRRGARTMGVAGGNNVFSACYLWYPDEDRLVLAMTCGPLTAERVLPDLAARVRDLPAI